MDYSVADFIRNGIFSAARSHLSMLIEAGVPLPTVVKFAGELQQSIHRALLQAAQSATIQMTGVPPEAPTFGQTFMEDDQSPPQQPPQQPDDKNPFA